MISKQHHNMAWLWLFAVLAGNLDTATAVETEICLGEESRVACERDHVIMITSADYGHMAQGRCISKQDQFLGCSNDVIQTLDGWCSGKRNCSIELPNDELEALNVNCLEFLRTYLKLEYACLAVHSQCVSSRPTQLPAQSGYLSSHVTDTKGCGNSRSPWIISANPGQTIQLDLIDFAANSQTSNLVSCRSVYGFILERALGINHTICGGRHREGALYTSKTNSVEIHLVTSDKRGGGQLVIKYEVTGCSELSRPAHAWYKREGNEAVIGCENNDQEWRLTCIGNTWQGEAGNCSTNNVIVEAPRIPNPSKIEFSTVVMVTGIGGMAIFLSVVAIVIGFIYVKKYKMRQEMERANVQKTYATMDRNVQAYYRPVDMNQSTNSGTGWDMPLPPDPHDQLTSYPDQCTCPTLQMRNQGDGDKTIGGASLERQSLYSSIKST